LIESQSIKGEMKSGSFNQGRSDWRSEFKAKQNVLRFSDLAQAGFRAILDIPVAPPSILQESDPSAFRNVINRARFIPLGN
jgi:hypothetical protein